MRALFSVLFIVLFAYSLLYLRFVIKRLILFSKIKVLCNKYRFELVKSHFLWFMGNTGMEKCDFYIVTCEKVYSVVLCRSLIKNCTLRFEGNTLTKEYNMILYNVWGQIFRIPFRLYSRQRRNCNFKYAFQPRWEGKEIAYIALINPAVSEIRKLTTKGEMIIGDGDCVWGLTIFSLRGFLREITEHSKRINGEDQHNEKNNNS